MAVSVTYNFTDAQAARIVQAKDIYNAANGTSLNSKQYGLTVLKAAVREALITVETEEAMITATATISGEATSIDADLVGNA